MTLVTKFCKRCGKIMWNVPPSKKYCDACFKEKRKQSKKAEREYTKKPKQMKKYTASKFKPIGQCVREAEKLHMSYGKYVSLGMDKVVLEEL